MPSVRPLCGKNSRKSCSGIIPIMSFFQQPVNLSMKSPSVRCEYWSFDFHAGFIAEIFEMKRFLATFDYAKIN